jgi:hypothetical protein
VIGGRKEKRQGGSRKVDGKGGRRRGRETGRQVEGRWGGGGREVKVGYPKIWFSLQNSETEKMWEPGTSKNFPLYRAL